MNKVVEFLNANPVQYLATVGRDGKAKCRPFMFAGELDGKLWFCTNNTKDVYKDMRENPEIEISVSSPEYAWIRLHGKAVFENNMAAKEMCIQNPIVKGQYGTQTESTIILDTEALMGGEDITNARPAFNEFGQSYVALEFNNRGASNFERITGEHIKKRMAIVLDGKVYSAPVIQDRIAGGKASITGNFTTEEAQDLAIVLRAGSLPTPVSVLEERTVGPSLGKESINSGIKASLVGAAAVVLVMPLYYGLSGLIADVMLCFTITILLAGMTLFGATLTLPGIAGIVLTIGMSVDANVLIFERIREELKAGMSAQVLEQMHIRTPSAFSRASISIIDSNLTTLITAAILYQFGTGPVRGFAVTLSLGILASMFTAVFVSRAVFESWVARSASQKISI